MSKYDEMRKELKHSIIDLDADHYRLDEFMRVIDEIFFKYRDEIEQTKIGGWIPCSERLPTKEESIKNDNRFILDDGNRRYGGLFDYEKQCFAQFDFWKGLVEDKCAIAWQPLPEAYHG